MNYIPGFSNYLQAAVPRYAIGGRVGYGERMMFDGGGYGDNYDMGGYDAAPIMDAPREAAVMPMTTEAAPNYSGGLNLSDADLAALASLNSASASGGLFNQGNYGSDFGSLDNVYGVNFGSDFGSGGSGGGLYKVNPYMKVYTAPLDNQGKPTAYNNNTLEVKAPWQVFRLVDQNTGKVVYEGTGYEGAEEAMKRASALSAEGGTKAKWDIQTPNSQQKSGYSTVATETRQQSTLGDIASFALPIGMALLTGGMSLPAQMAGAAMAGAAGAGLAGKDPLKAGLISGATAGLMGGSGLNDAIGRTVGNVGGALAGKTVEEAGKQAGAKALEQIVVTGLSKAAQGAGSAIGNTLLSEGVKGGLSSVTGYKTPAEQFADQSLPNTSAPTVDIYSGLKPIDVTALSKFTQGAGDALGNTALSGAVKGPLSEIVSTETPKTTEKTAEDIEAEKNPMVVTARELETLTPDELLASLGGAPTSLLPDNFFEPPSTDVNKKLTAKDIADYLRLASLGVSTVGGLLGDKGGGSGGTIPAGMGALSSLFSKQLPPSTLRGVGNGALPASTLAAQGFNSPQNYYRYGYGPEQSFFDYATQGAPNTSRAYTGYEGTTAEDAFAPQPMRMATPQITLPQPITTPIPNNPAGPSMYAPEVDSMRFARGGFAVEGAGDGRDDKIPALLSDGEYVFDAETVALLGNGSNKAGAKLLDSFRVKVRKQKGKKLARGKFSDNAKRPEQYMAGGPA